MAPRLRQAVIAARDLEATVARLRSELGLGEPFDDPAVGYFGVRNAVFALGDTFLEVVSPVRDDAPAARWLERRGGDSGYMLMFQVEDLAAARERARLEGVREVFEVGLDDIAEVHLHPADMRGAIVALSEPRPPGSWRWGGPDWPRRSARARLVGATVALADPDAGRTRWEAVTGRIGEIRFDRADSDLGVIEIRIASPSAREPIEIGGIHFSFLEEAQ
jgi:catechol 2,3-dioxygenase-like lactoylglutathione lyase family enzyme